MHETLDRLARVDVHEVPNVCNMKDVLESLDRSLVRVSQRVPRRRSEYFCRERYKIVSFRIPIGAKKYLSELVVYFVMTLLCFPCRRTITPGVSSRY